MTLKHSIIAGMGLVALLTGAALAEPMKLSADLSGQAETPPVSSKGTGMLTGSYDPSTKSMTFAVTYSGLTGPAVAAHFHAPAPAGKSAGVEIPVKGSLTSPIKGEMTLTDSQAKNLTDGMTYFNIHTAEHKAGELRGQISVGK